jgi:uncharacterized membrane protein YeaQ/YmgE (transglycosylase-associated protein family)
MVHFIWWIVTGLVVGALARFLMPGRDPMGCIVTILLGIAGSFLGGFIGSLIWGSPGGRFQPGGFLLSLLGAILLLFIWRRLRR